MIFVHDKGQMCNNILQYGHVYAWARENNRSCVSMRFAYKYQFFNICTSRNHNFLMYLIGKYGGKTHLLPTVEYNLTEKGKSEKERFILSHKNVVVDGWGVRYYDLFLKYKKEIQELFEFKKEIRNKIHDLISKKKDSIKIGVHIRRGDYRTFFGGRYFFDDEAFVHYINSTINLLGKNSVVVYICGNDSTLNKEFYHEKVKGAEVVFPMGNAGEDLCLLSKCDFLIGPPSSFSLVATMYGKARLYWMTSPRKDIRDTDFRDFDYLFRVFDDYWKQSFLKATFQMLTMT